MGGFILCVSSHELRPFVGHEVCSKKSVLACIRNRRAIPSFPPVLLI